MPTCDICKKPTWACVCDVLTSHASRIRVVVLQHPQEDDRMLGTARLLIGSLPSASLHVGLSWPSFSAAVGAPIERQRWAVVAAAKLPEGVSPPAPGNILCISGASPIDPQTLDGIILLDGTWSQAKTLWWRNPWLLKHPRIVLTPREPSIYGRLRREPRREWVSTLEAAADVLVALGEPETLRQDLRKAMRTMLQRVRDHGSTP